MKHAKGVAAVVGALVVAGAAIAWTRSAYNDNIERAVAELAEASYGAYVVTRSVSDNIFVGQTERLDFTVEVDPVNGEAVVFSAISRVVFLPAFVTGDLHFDISISGFKVDEAGLDLAAGADDGRWWLNALTGMADINYRSPEVVIKGGDAGEMVATVRPAEFDASIDTGSGEAHYHCSWPGLNASFAQVGSFDIGAMTCEGGGSFGAEPNRQQFTSTVAGMNATFPGVTFSVGEVHMEGEQAIEQGYLDATAVVRSGSVTSRSPISSIDISSIEADYRIKHLHVDSYNELMLLSRTETSSTAEQTLQALLKLASHGVGIGIEKLAVRHDNTESTLTGHFDVIKPDAALATLDELKPYLDARLDLDISDKLFGSGEMVEAMLGGLVEQGLLQRDEQGRLTLQAAIADGMLTMNGKAQPL